MQPGVGQNVSITLTPYTTLFTFVTCDFTHSTQYLDSQFGHVTLGCSLHSALKHDILLMSSCEMDKKSVFNLCAIYIFKKPIFVNKKIYLLILAMKQPGCKICKNPNYSHRVGKVFYCDTCKPKNAVLIKSHCAKCYAKNALYGYNVQTRYCENCKSEDMKTFTFGYCKLCKTRRANFGFPSPRTSSLRCFDCKEPGMVCVNKAMCQVCDQTRAYFGFPTDEKASCCAGCKLEGMIDIVNKRCFYCNKRNNDMKQIDGKHTCSKCMTKKFQPIILSDHVRKYTIDDFDVTRYLATEN